MRSWSHFGALLLSLFACRREAPWREQSFAGVRFFERFEGGADDSSPLVIGLHGQSGSAERFSRTLRDVPFVAELAYPDAPFPSGKGWSWFDWPPGTSDDQLAAIVGAAEERLWPAIVALAHGRKVIVTGFSQGAMLAYVIAARHPDAVAYAFPIAGRIPAKLLPRGPAAPVYAMHGVDDDAIAIDFGREAIAAFRAAGNPAELREWPGVAHDITPAMRADLAAHLARIVGP